MFVNGIRALSGPSSASSGGRDPAAAAPAAAPAALAAYTTPGALDAVASLLAAPYPVLLNEGLVALALASLTARQAVEDALMRPSRVQTAPAPAAAQPTVTEVNDDGTPAPDAQRVGLAHTEQARPVDKLAAVLLPSPGAGGVGPEIKANAAALARSVGGRVADTVAARLGDEARIVAMDA